VPGIHFYFPDELDFTRGFDAIREEFEVSTTFPADVQEAARRAARRAENADRRDLRDIPFIAIDPPGSLDLDQAFFASRTKDGYRVLYAIADVTHFVEPEGPIDRAARQRGLTFYAPDRRAPLHPQSLSQDAASLLPGVDRPALVWEHELDEYGNVTGSRVERALVRNSAALSYQEVQDNLETDEPEPLHDLLRRIGLARQKQEASRGGVSLNLPAQEVTRKDGSYVLEFHRSLPLENWNAQISLLTGIAAAGMMIDAKVGLIRTLPKPARSTIAFLRRHSAALDVPYPADMSYSDWVRSLNTAVPEQAALMTQAARALRGAGYAGFDGRLPDYTSHSAIAADYAHVTAPLRRLIDRFGNEIVLALSAGMRPPEWVIAALEPIPDMMMAASRRERAFERAIVDFAESLTLSHRVGDTFRAVVTNVDDDRLTCQIRQPAVVASFRASGVGLGDEIEVRLAAVDVAARSVNFEVA